MAKPAYRAYTVIKREGKDDNWLNLGVAFPICYTANTTDTDIARHDAPQPDGLRHTLTVCDVKRMLRECRGLADLGIVEHPS